MEPSTYFRAQAPTDIKEGSWFLVDLKTAAVLFEEDPVKESIEKAQAIMNGSKDVVNHPSHYNTGKIEVIEFIEDQRLDYPLGNTVKYICRAGRKDATKEIEDLKKAAWYLNRKIETLTAQKEGRAVVRPNDMKAKS